MRQKPQQFIPVILLLFVASCVQLASEEVAPTQVGSNATWTPIPTETVLAPATETPTEIVAAEVAATEDVLIPTDPSLAFETQTAIPTSTPTDTPTATPTATFTATATPTLTEAVSGLVQEGTAIAQDDAPTLDPGAGGNTGQITEFEATATALIVNATQTQVVAQTQTAIAILGPTSTPAPPEGIPPTEDPLGTGTDGGGSTAPIAPGADCIHEVRTVDQNLYRLSLAYGVPIRSIRNANGTAIANPNIITIGQRLLIPGCGTTGGRPPATSTPGPVTSPGGGTGIGGPGVVLPPNGDCSWGTSVEFPNGCPTGGGTNTSGSVGTGGSTGAGTGGPGTTPGIIHIVEQGETLSGIALQYGTTPEAIAAANGIGLESTIFFNQELIIPQ